MSASSIDGQIARNRLFKPSCKEVAANRDLYQSVVKFGNQYSKIFPNQKSTFAKTIEIVDEIEKQFSEIKEVYQGQKKKIALVIHEENHGLFDSFFNKNLQGISAIKNSSALFNLFRLYWTFNRLTATQLLRLFKQVGWIDGLAQFLHDKFDLDLNINIEETIKKLEALNEMMRFLSVALFFVRLCVDVFLLIKHTFNAKEDQYSTRKQRFQYELKKRGLTILNDVGWTIGNIVGNYNHLFKISDMTAGYVTIGFLVFDVALIIVRWVFDKMHFDEQMKALEAELQQEQDPEKKRFIEYSISQLRQEFNAKCFGNAVNLAAALCIISGFLVQHLLSGVLLASTFGFAACMIGVSLYLSSDLIQAFRKSQLTLEKLMCFDKKYYPVEQQKDLSEMNPEALQAAEAEYKIARNQMILGLVRNILLPSLFLFACALAWQVCIGLAVATIIVSIVQYKIAESYKKLSEGKVNDSDNNPKLPSKEKEPDSPEAVNSQTAVPTC